MRVQTFAPSGSGGNASAPQTSPLPAKGSSVGTAPDFVARRSVDYRHRIGNELGKPLSFPKTRFPELQHSMYLFLTSTLFMEACG